MSPSELTALYERSYAFITSGTAARKLETGELYSVFELHFYLALLTSHDVEAAAILTTLSDRFGSGSPRVAVLEALNIEATETLAKALEFIDKRPETEIGAWKRRIAILKTTAGSAPATMKTQYVTELVKLVDHVPSDAEAWSELAHAYIDAGLYSQALFALHEVLLLVPLAYNINALVGEIGLKFSSVLQSQGSTALAEDKLVEAVKFFLRSVELCEDYVRGWTGVLVGSTRILQQSKPTADVKLYQLVQEMARKQLQKIVDTKDARAEDLAAAEMVLKNYK
ncbi:hypothetical protein BZA70DRAFT_240555 [Myxozyma melibiosi]|uniref:ER membrane protein complex subunit 2 n=1 Tax=Myxozyma melibiosi TaxID=54550 RepID=A0ABR1F2D7_9ASCO